MIPDRLGDYEILHRLSSGGMGEVLLARKRGTGGFERLAAIKTIRSDLEKREGLRTMFEDEARLLSRLTHPAVAQVYDFGEHDGTLYLVMEYVAGVSFRELDGVVGGRIPAGVACRAVAQGCRGLHAAHELKDEHGVSLGVVHRDISPDNLMLTFDGAVQVLDFGIALMKGRSAPVTDYGTIKGKPPYLSPEQVRGEAVDRRSDVFSACVVLWELLAGEPLFSGDSIYTIGLSVLEKDIPPPSSLGADIPAELDDVIACGLARDPALRFHSALAVAEALDAVASRTGAESLALYAGRELAGVREHHRRWLADIRGGRGEPVGRPSHVMTAVGSGLRAGEGGGGGGGGSGGGSGGEGGGGGVGRGGREFDDGAAGGRRADSQRSRPLGIAAAALVGAALGGLIWWQSAGGQHATAGVEGSGAVGEIDGGAPALAISTGSELADAAIAFDASPPVAVVPDAARRTTASSQRASDPKDRARDRARRRRPDAGLRRSIDAGVAGITGHGFLTVTARPFASVRIDGVEVGSTPIFRRRIGAGQHVVELVSPDSGAVRKRQTVTIEADGTARVDAVPADN